MALTIRYFASLREQLQCEQESLDKGDCQTVADVRNALLSRYDASNREALASALCALNHEFSQDNAPVKDGDEIAFFPPVTGG